MANDDVLDDIDVIALQNGVPPMVRELIYRLAKELRASRARVAELEQDARRLDWILVSDARLIWSMRDQRHYAVKADGDVVGGGAYGKKAAIDAAMAGEDDE